MSSIPVHISLSDTLDRYGLVMQKTIKALSTSLDRTPNLVVVAAASAAILGTIVGAKLAAYSCSQELKPKAPPLDDDDAWFRIAWQALEARSLKPRQSNFRVVAVIVYKPPPGCVRDKNAPFTYVVGHNDEGCALTQAVCAERAAFLQLTALGQESPVGQENCVHAVYIVSDAADAITPGVLCREFMSSSLMVSMKSTRIVMEGSKFKASGRRCSTLAKLWPFCSPFTRLAGSEQRVEGERLARRIAARGDQWDRNSPQALVREAATTAAAKDVRDDLHPIRLGAAVAFSDGTIRSSWQRKALEFGCSLDPICQLAPDLETLGIPTSALPGFTDQPKTAAPASTSKRVSPVAIGKCRLSRSILSASHVVDCSTINSNRFSYFFVLLLVLFHAVSYVRPVRSVSRAFWSRPVVSCRERLGSYYGALP